MPRYIFPAGSLTNTTGNPLRLTCFGTNTSNRRESDLWTIDGSNSLVSPIPNGVILTDVSGNYATFAGPDDIDALYVNPNTGASRTKLTSVAMVTGTGDSVLASLVGGGGGSVDSINTVAASGATQTLPDPATSSVSDITLTANCALTFPTATSGKAFTVMLRQDATGGRTVTWPVSVKWPNGYVPTVTPTASAVDVYSFMCVAGAWVGLPSGYDIR